ncbi:hypothetical protein CIHG_08990 [Coccidioides immitis H538.4]|uniref:Uncharacterized protein n=1 Tax=Coccidioides immitis H538.4 TaxID=396776 RepID=A0A0J8S0W8_COCIT|nr:hypothetical protein CIHG_08990 [Coccidioides immitis H538.4]
MWPFQGMNRKQLETGWITMTRLAGEDLDGVREIHGAAGNFSIKLGIALFSNGWHFVQSTAKQGRCAWLQATASIQETFMPVGFPESSSCSIPGPSNLRADRRREREI